MGSGSSINTSGTRRERTVPSSHLQSRGMSERFGEPSKSLNVDTFTPLNDKAEGDDVTRSFLVDVDHPNLQSSVHSSFSEGPLLTEAQEAKVKSCLTTLEGLLKDSQLRFDTRNILPHVTVMHEEGSIDAQLLDRVGEGLFVIDTGAVDLLSPSSTPSDEVPVIRLSEGDFCGEYTTLFNVPFRIKVQFKSSVDLLHLPADVVRVNMHYTGHMGRDAMLKLSIVQSNLISGELFGEDISSRVVARCLKASLFSVLGSDALDFLADTVTPLLFSSGEVVYSEGEMATYMFLVLKGTVQLVRQGQPYQTHKINFSSEGVSIAAKEFFGGSMLSHQAIADGPLLLASIGREQLLDMLNKFPDDTGTVKTILQRT